MNIEQRIAITGGRSTGFDYMRIMLAVLIVCWHSIGTSYGQLATTQIMASPFRACVAILLPMFFSLSGFLVAGSLARTKTLFMFLGLRSIRIFPALGVEVLLSAFIFGPLLTNITVAGYFSDRSFYEYLLNVFGNIHYQLPGVFTGNPLPNYVNGQLWTVPYELKCYIALALLTFIGAIRHRAILIAAIIAVTAIEIARAAILSGESFGIHDPAAPGVPGWVLIVSFLLGVAIYLYREKLNWNAQLAAFAGIAGALLLSVRYGDYFAAIPLAYLTVYLGLLNPKKVKILAGADYSYGVFLYGFAVQQVFASMGQWAHQWWLNILVCLPATCSIAVLSWHCVEKPALSYRTQLKALEQKWLERRTRILTNSWIPDWLKLLMQGG